MQESDQMFDDSEFLFSQTDDIVVSACPVLIDEEKTMSDKKFLWGYYLCIENNSSRKISLLGKNWKITDDKGNSFSDDTCGFKGEIPELEPGECFEYTSMAPIAAANAVFYGSCKIKAEGQDIAKEVKIPTFCLSAKNKPEVSVH